jgi:translation initiation factor 3 subunit A
MSTPPDCLPSPLVRAAAASPVKEMPLEAFAGALQHVAVAKMVRQLSEVYSVVRVSTMSDLAPFIGFGQVTQLLAGQKG